MWESFGKINIMIVTIENTKNGDRASSARLVGIDSRGRKVSTLRQLSCLEQSVRVVASPRASRDPYPYFVQHASRSYYNFDNENIFQKRFDLTCLTSFENVEITSLLSSWLRVKSFRISRIGTNTCALGKFLKNLCMCVWFEILIEILKLIRNSLAFRSIDSFLCHVK